MVLILLSEDNAILETQTKYPKLMSMSEYIGLITICPTVLKDVPTKYQKRVKSRIHRGLWAKFVSLIILINKFARGKGCMVVVKLRTTYFILLNFTTVHRGIKF